MTPEEEQRYIKLARLIERQYLLAQAHGKGEQFTNALSDALEQALTQSAENLAERLKRDAPAMLTERREVRARFEARLRERWRPALDFFEMILVIAQEAGSNFLLEHRRDAKKSQDLRFWVLARLHARACHIASEVMALLNSGFATAAMARWRTIHEVAVIMWLIQNSEGNELAQRYLDHEAVEAATAAEHYNDHYARLGLEPLDAAEYEAIIARRNKMVDRYGSEFKQDTYGWANEAVGCRVKKFERLELAAGLDHMRPYYKMASYGVHGNPKGILFHLEEIRPTEFLIAGASDVGLADPGHATIISLLQCTIAFLHTRPNDVIVMTTMAMSRLVDDAGRAFSEIHRQMLQEFSTSPKDTE